LPKSVIYESVDEEEDEKKSFSMKTIDEDDEK
jgi:hypothetical protein